MQSQSAPERLKFIALGKNINYIQYESLGYTVYANAG
jgi:hypothetical protein